MTANYNIITAQNGQQGRLNVIDADDRYFKNKYGMTPRNFFIYGRYLTESAKNLYTVLSSYRNAAPERRKKTDFQQLMENEYRVKGIKKKFHQCNPKIEDLMSNLGYGKTKINNLLDELETFGWIRRYNLPRIGGRMPSAQTDFIIPVDDNNSYRIQPTKQDAADFKKYIANKRKKDEKTRESLQRFFAKYNIKTPIE